MRRIALALALMILLPVGARADRHRAGAAAAFVQADRSDLKGIQLSFDGTLWGERKVDPKTGSPFLMPDHTGTFSLILETSWVSGDHEGENLGQATILGGLRYTLNKLPFTRFQNLQPFGQGLAGQFWNVTEGSASDAFALGLGVDWLPAGDDSRWALRLRYDWTRIGTPAEWYGQWSLGLVVRIKDTYPYKEPIP